ncbi:phosphomannomutase/phosphoglucomutase [Candidatus Gracilibacteria bacterium]|nr:phosphomannomutase/phosphoglucomutase [Candidatus Gracilibacteria bacterium]
MILDPKIFRAYDIRGVAFQDFDEDGFFIIAQSFCTFLTQKTCNAHPRIFVSGDGRLSMGELYPAVIAGLEAGGAEVTWGGILPTPVNYFALHEGNFDATLQITASHNPAEYNGLKLTDRNGAVCGEQIQEIRKISECTECHPTKSFGECAENCQLVSFGEQYEQKIFDITGSQKAKHIVVDAGNGVAGILYPEILEKLGHRVERLYCDLDPTFPHHQPDPERPENLHDLVQEVQSQQADFGLAFDGDGDRVGMVLSDGTVLNADKILFVLAADFLSRHPETPIVIDAMTSATLVEKIKSLGGDPVFSVTGHSYIETKMKEVGAKLGGEQSGHFMLGENFYGHDDALLAALRFLSAIEKSPQLLLEVSERWPKLLEYSEKISVPDEKKFEIIENVKTRLTASLQENKNIKLSTLDGIRLDFGNGEWGIIRCSNTSPCIAVRIEAKDQKSLDEKKTILLDALHAAEA